MKQLFPAGKPVAGRMFVGREKLMDELNNILTIGQSVVLIAPRRYGKTSIALEMLANFRRKDYFVAEIDIFDITDKRHLAEKIIESCLQNNPVSITRFWKKLKLGALNVLSMLKFKPSDDEMELVLQLGMPKIDEDKVLGDALDFPERFSSRYKKTMILFIDEFQEIIKVGGMSLLKKMRSKFQRHNNVIYIFAGSQESLMKDLFQSRQHAFYRFGRLFEVGEIAGKDFTPYIIKSFEGEDMQIAGECVENILAATGGHPYYTQLLCQMIFIGCLAQKKNNIDKDDVESAQLSVLEHELAYFDEIWKELGNKKFSRNIVIKIANVESPYSYTGTTKENIARILSDLIRYGYLSKHGSGKNIEYQIKDPFLKKYILNKEGG